MTPMSLPQPHVRPALVVPADLATALAGDVQARTVFDALSYTNRREHIEALTEAKRPATRARRLEKAIERLRSGRPSRSTTVSVRPTVAKMRIRPGQRIAVLDADDAAMAIFDAMPDGCTVDRTATKGPYDVVVMYPLTAAALGRRLPVAIAASDRNTALWIAYPKQSSGRATTLTRDVGWESTDRDDLRVVTMIAFDEVWAGVQYRVG